jgi:hypothetical protein
MVYMPVRSIDIETWHGAFNELAVFQKQPKFQTLFQTHIDPNIFDIDTTGSAYCDVSAGFAVLATGIVSEAAACTVRTHQPISYHSGQGIAFQGSAVFTTGVANTTQLFGYGDDSNGVFFGYNGTSFGVLRRHSGSDTWTAQSSWNMDKLDGSAGTSFTADWTKGNVFFIQIQYHGVGGIGFWVENGDTNEMVLAHLIKFAGANTTTNIGHPSLPAGLYVSKSSGTSEVTLKSASFAVFHEGIDTDVLERDFCYAMEKSSVLSQTCVFTLRVKSSFKGQTVTDQATIRRITFASEGTKPVSLRIYKNANLIGLDTYTDVSENGSIMEVCTTKTTLHDREPLSDVGTAMGSTANTITLAATASSTDDYYNGRVITIMSADTHPHQSRVITDYNGTTKVATVANWTNAVSPGVSITYVIENGLLKRAYNLAKNGSLNIEEDISHIRLAPGDTLSFMVESTVSADVNVGCAWVEGG